MNCNYKLTKDRVERAIAEMTEKREVAVKMLEKDGMQGMLLFGWKKDLALIDTLLAALDAVRWRDVETEPPKTNATVIVRWREENGVQRYKFSYFEDGIWWGTIGVKDARWLPLPKWED